MIAVSWTRSLCVAILSFFVGWWAVVAASGAGAVNLSHRNSSGRDLWVVLVGTSRNWLNYRDNSNTIALYRMFRKLGVPDSRIILMLGHSMACDPRNPHPGHLYINPDHVWDLYQEPIEIDYRGADVTVDNFLRLLSGLHSPGTPLSRQLRSSQHSDVLIYLTGHGGDKFLKFQDKEELQANDLADALHQMYLQKRYRSMLLMSDTCQADSLHSQLRSPGILAIASSAKGENSYSFMPDTDLGVPVVDRFTFTTLRFLEDALHYSFQSQGGAFLPRHSLAGLFAAYDAKFLMSTPCMRSDLYRYPLDEVPALQYFVTPDTEAVDETRLPVDSAAQKHGEDEEVATILDKIQDEFRAGEDLGLGKSQDERSGCSRLDELDLWDLEEESLTQGVNGDGASLSSRKQRLSSNAEQGWILVLLVLWLSVVLAASVLGLGSEGSQQQLQVSAKESSSLSQNGDSSQCIKRGVK